MRIAIVAGEISGDRLGAGLIRAIKQTHPDADFVGIGGEAMIKEGCRSLFSLDQLSVMGLVEVLGQYRSLRAIQHQLIQEFTHNPPDVFVGIDYKEFNLSLSAKLKAQGIKTVQYVSPQIWAWRPWRVKRIAKQVDQILSVLPFEPAYYDGHDVKVDFIGHPLADAIPLETDDTGIRRKLHLDPDVKVIALLPGSRKKEWEYHMRLFLDVAVWCQTRRPDTQFLIALVNDRAEAAFKTSLESYAEPPKNLRPLIGQAQDVISASNVVLCVSGTATLEIMLLKRPMVIAYRMAWLTYQIAKHLVKLPYIGLPSLLAGKKTAPEFIQEAATVPALGQALFDWIDNQQETQNTMQLYDQIHREMRKNADETAAKVVLELCQN